MDADRNEKGPWTVHDDIEVYLGDERLDLLAYGVVRADGKRTLDIRVAHFGSTYQHEDPT